MDQLLPFSHWMAAEKHHFQFLDSWISLINGVPGINLPFDVSKSLAIWRETLHEQLIMGSTLYLCIAYTAFRELR